MNPPPANTVAARRILVRGVNWLGDAVMTTPALLRLREAYPEADITLLTPQKLKELYDGHPAINRVETFANGENVWSIGKRLKPSSFDLGIVLPNSTRSALELWLSGARVRVGYAGNWRSAFLTKAVRRRSYAVEMHKRTEAEIKERIAKNSPREKIPATAHHIYNYLHLVSAIGCNPAPVAPLLNVSAANVEAFEHKFKLRGSSGERIPWLGLNAGAEYGPAKRWPEERFIAAAIEIQRRTNCCWLVFGIKADLDLATRITNAINQSVKNEPAKITVNLTGATSLGELCAGLKLCRAVLTNDSGPMHVASALGTPVVVPFGSTSPELTGPGLPNGGTRQKLLSANVPCSPCFLRDCPVDFRCMKNLEVAEAVEAVCGFCPL